MTRSDNQLVMAWSRDPTLVSGQLTHAARPGSSKSICRVDVTAWGDDWPDDNVLVSGRARCTMCAHQIAVANA